MNKYFFKNINEINEKENIKCGLYLMDVKYMNKEYIDKNIVKFGYTQNELIKRLKSYKDCNLENIYFYTLESPYNLMVELLIKRFLKHTSLFPIIGHEYYSDCKDYIKLIIEEILKNSFNDINIYYNYCVSKNSKCKNIFSDININILKIDNSYNYYTNEINNNINALKKDNNINENSDKYFLFCEFCKKEYNSISSLNYHKKTTKFCLEIQQKYEDISKYECTCFKKFTKKDTYLDHLKVCKIKKQLNNEELEKQNLIYDNLLSEKDKELEKQKNNYERLLSEKDKELEIQKNNYELLLSEKDNQIKFKNEYLESFEKKYNDLITILKNKN